MYLSVTNVPFVTHGRNYMITIKKYANRLVTLL